MPWRERRADTSQIGVVFGQRTQLWWDLAVVECFDLLRDIYGVSEADYARRMKVFDELLDLGRFLDAPVRQLSLGQRMRVRPRRLAPARARRSSSSTSRPSASTSSPRRTSARSSRSQQARATTVILTTHDLDDIEELCERVVLIDHGQILYDGSLRGLRDRHLPEARIRFDLNPIPAGDPAELAVGPWRAARLSQGRYQVVVDKREVSTADVLREIVRDLPVLDLAVGEPDIEEVVARIYRENAALRRPDAEALAEGAAPGVVAHRGVRRG